MFTTERLSFAVVSITKVFFFRPIFMNENYKHQLCLRVNKAKFLGVIVDQHLNWKDHISMISQKISVMRHNISNSQQFRYQIEKTNLL